jgi:adenylate kinase
MSNSSGKAEVLILVGAPGCGKGTVCPKLVADFKLVHLSTGDMLREAVAAGNEKIKEIMASGALVSDDIVIGLIMDKLNNRGDAKGFILDGFPRNVAQAKALDTMLAANGERVTKVIELAVPDEVLEERICGRWIHQASGRSYHVKFNPPKSMSQEGAPMLDEQTDEPLMQRPDDNATALKKRLATYHEQTVPILSHYEPAGIVTNVKADQSIDAVWNDVRAAMLA